MKPASGGLPPVVILSLSEDRLAHGLLGMIRSLGRMGVPVHLLGAGAFDVIERSRYLCTAAPLHDTHVATVAKALAAVPAAIGPDPVLFPFGDSAAMAIDELDADLRGRFRFSHSPSGLARSLADKASLDGLAGDHGIPTPKCIRPASLDEALTFADHVGYPVMVKAIDPRQIDWDAGEVSVSRVDDRFRLGHSAAHEHDARHSANLMVQEFVPGGTDAVWFFHGYLDANSTCLAGFVGQKLREHPPGAGPTTLGVARANSVVRRQATEFLTAVAYAGLVDAEFRFDARTGEYLLIDLNPRIGSNFRVFVDEQGFDVVRIAYLDLIGRPTTAGSAIEGRRWLVESQDPVTWRAYFGSGRRPWRELARSLRGVDELAWWAGDDRGPAGAMVATRSRDLARRLGRKVSGRT